MAVTVLTAFENFGSRSSTGAEWASVLNPPTSMNFDTGTIATTAADNGVQFRAALDDTGVLTSDVITSVLVEFDFVQTVSNANGGLRSVDPATGPTYPALLSPTNVGGTVSNYGTITDHMSQEMLSYFTGGSSITRAELFAGGTADWLWNIRSRYNGAFSGHNVRLQISNFKVTITDDAPVDVTNVSPAQGTYRGGTPVTVTVSGGTAGLTAVFFGAAEADDFSIVNSTTITCTTPPHMTGGGTVEVTVS